MNRELNSIILSLIEQHQSDCIAVYLFGSHANATAGPNSDIDIALLLAKADSNPAVSLTTSQLHQQLESTLNCDVDLVDLASVSTEFQAEILRQNIVLLDRDPAFRLEFESRVLSQLQALNFERRHIVQSFRDDHRAYRL